MGSYGGAEQAREARESLGKALGALQEERDIPKDVLGVAQNLAQSIGSLFEAERATSESAGKASIRNALSSLSQTLALLQDVRSDHRGIAVATEVIARSMGVLWPLTQKPTHAPAPTRALAEAAAARPPSRPAPPPSTGPRRELEVNIGATTESNFFVGFSGEVSAGGVFVATYDVLPVHTSVHVLVTLPGGYEFRTEGWVRFVRDPMSFDDDAEPGMGVQFERLAPDARELVMRFLRKRPPMFYDD